MIGHLVRTGITVGSYPAERRRMCRGPAPPASAESSSELGYGFVTTVILDHTCSSTAPATFPPPPAASSIPPLYLPTFRLSQRHRAPNSTHLRNVCTRDHRRFGVRPKMDGYRPQRARW
ncbi:hypothetical protein B0H10DRAFT_2218438 [Mycena sp. CBHHK59/15]|nr:hypothetical protein B0H10DRAFT_2218438 [Mycena sp. CBHHK59/15]